MEPAVVRDWRLVPEKVGSMKLVKDANTFTVVKSEK